MRNLIVGLLGHSVSSPNLGVGALTLSNMAIAEKIGQELGIEISFRLLASLDDGESCFVGDNLVRVPLRTRAYLRPRDGLFAAVRQCDIVLDITGGDSFADIYGLSRFLRDALSKSVALSTGRPFILSPQTIGPFERPWTRWVAVRLMRRARAVVSRDELTTEFLEPLGLGSSLIQSTDVAFRLPYRRTAPPQGDRVRVGLNVSGLLFNGGYTRSNMFGLQADYRDVARGLLRTFDSFPECEIHLVSHVISATHEIEDDFRVSEQLAQEFPDVIVAPRFKGPSEAKSYISGLDFFAGSRMHACIAALSSGVPVLPIAYSRKFAGVFGSLGYSVIADCRTQSMEDIIVLAARTYQEREVLRPMIRQAIRKADEKLACYESVMRDSFEMAVSNKRSGAQEGKGAVRRAAAQRLSAK